MNTVLMIFIWAFVPTRLKMHCNLWVWIALFANQHRKVLWLISLNCIVFATQYLKKRTLWFVIVNCFVFVTSNQKKLIYEFELYYACQSIMKCVLICWVLIGSCLPTSNEWTLWSSIVFCLQPAMIMCCLRMSTSMIMCG